MQFSQQRCTAASYYVAQVPLICLNAHWFMSLDDAVRKCEAWRRDYNEVRRSQRDRQQTADIAAIRVNGTWPALTSERWIDPSQAVQDRGAAQ
jgi:hypothetical protein